MDFLPKKKHETNLEYILSSQALEQNETDLGLFLCVSVKVFSLLKPYPRDRLGLMTYSVNAKVVNYIHSSVRRGQVRFLILADCHLIVTGV